MKTNRLILLILALLMLLNIAAIAEEAAQPPKADQFTFVVLGDSRGGSSYSPIFDKMVEEINKLNPAFVVHTGDAVNGTTDTPKFTEQLTAFKKATEKLKMPFYLIPGNHEIRNSVNNEIAYRRIFGEPYQSFNYGNSHFVLLDSEVPDQGNRIMGNQMGWLKKDLKKGMKAKHRFVFVHAPLFPAGPHAGSSLDKFPMERNDLFDWLKRYQVKYVFAGHEHLYNRSEHDGVIQIITGGAGAPLYGSKSSGGFYHYMVVTVDGKNVDAKVVEVEK